MSESPSRIVLQEYVPRLEQIRRLLQGLSKLNPGSDTRYAVEENIAFFSAARSVWSYIKWLFWRSGKIDGDRLLEINELLLGLDEEMHDQLTRAGRRKFPGLLCPITDRLTSNIISSEDARVRVIDIGSGGMEIERQILQNLLNKNYSSPITFVGADISIDALSRAKKNIATLGSNVYIKFVEHLNPDTIEHLEHDASVQFLVLLCHSSVDDLLRTCPRDYFSFAFTSLFLHHIPRSVRIQILQHIGALARDVIHYDGYRSPMNLIPQSLIAWWHPVFLNAVVFSNLRYMKKDELRSFHADSRVTFYAHGHYVSENIIL